jgi:cardiolipin synthase
MLIDDDLLMIGSANLDDRSMRLNFELNILLRREEGAKALERVFEEDFAESHELEFRTFKQRPLKSRLLEALVRPLAPMT